MALVEKSSNPQPYPSHIAARSLSAGVIHSFVNDHLSGLAQDKNDQSPLWFALGTAKQPYRTRSSLFKCIWNIASPMGK